MKIVNTRLTKIFIAIFAPGERLPSSATLPYSSQVYLEELPDGIRQVINPVEALGRTGWLLVSVLALVQVESTLQSSGSEPPSQNMGRPPLRSKSPLLRQRATASPRQCLVDIHLLRPSYISMEFRGVGTK